YRDQGGIRIAAVHDHLQPRGLPFLKILSKARVDLNRNRDLAAINQVAYLSPVGQVRADIKVGTGGKARQEIPAHLALIVIQHRGGNVADFQGRCIAEYKHLNDGRGEQEDAGAFVPEDLNKFLDEHSAKASQHENSYVSFL